MAIALRSKHLWYAIVSTLVMLVLAVGLCEWAGWPFLKKPLEQQLSQKLQRDVRFGDEFRLHLLGAIKLQSQSFSIGPAHWEKPVVDQAGLVEAREVQLVLPYRTVLGRIQGNGQPLRVSRLEVGSINARLYREAQGRANWQFGSDDPGAAMAVPHFDHLIVREGHLDLLDAFMQIDIEAFAHTEEGPSVSIEKDGSKAADTAQGFSIDAKGHYQDKTFTATAHSPGMLPLVAPEGASTPIALTFDLHMGANALSFKGQAIDLFKLTGIDGEFKLSGPSLALVGDALGATLPTTAAFKTQGKIRKLGARWDIAVAEFAVGRSHLAGNFRYDMTAKRPRLSGEVRGTELALEDLAPALGAPASGASAPATTIAPSGKKSKTESASARILPQREFDIPSLHRMDATVDVKLDRVDLGSLFVLPLQPVQGKLTLDQGVLKLDQLLARTADGELRGQLLLDARPKEPIWTSDLQWSGVKLEKWLRARNSFVRKSERIPVNKTGSETVAPPFITGQLGGQAKLRGTGKSTAHMLSTLDGTAQVWIRHGAISQLIIEVIGLDVAKTLGLLVRGDKDIPINCAAISMSARNGDLQSEVGIVDTPDSMVLLSGNISLADEKLDLTVKAKPNDLSLLSLRSPLHIKGSFSQPKVRPDAKALGLKAGAAGVLAVFVTPLAALLSVIDPGSSSSKGEGCAQALSRLQGKPETPAAMRRALSAGKPSS